MTNLEQRAAQCLYRIRYAPGNLHEPRAKTLHRLWKNDPLWSLSFLDQADLWFLIWHYRRQVNDAELVAHADTVVNGALELKF